MLDVRLASAVFAGARGGMHDAHRRLAHLRLERAVTYARWPRLVASLAVEPPAV